MGMFFPRAPICLDAENLEQVEVRIMDLWGFIQHSISSIMPSTVEDVGLNTFVNSDLVKLNFRIIISAVVLSNTCSS